MKDGGHHYFISSLDINEPGMSPDSRAQAAFVLAVICDGHRRGRLMCAEQGLLQKLLALLSSMVSSGSGFWFRGYMLLALLSSMVSELSSRVRRAV